MKKNHLSGIYLASALSVLSSLSPVHAQFSSLRGTMQNINSPTTGSAFWRNDTYIDFSSTTTHSFRAWGTSYAGGQNLKTYSFSLGPVIGTSGGNQCYDVFTARMAYAAETDNADTRLWIYDAPNLVSISDDYNGTLYSHARIWTNSGSIYLYVTPYGTGTGYDDIDFYVTAQRLNLTTATACQGSGVNFVNTTVNPYSYTWVTNH